MLVAIQTPVLLFIYHFFGPDSWLSGLTIFFAVWFPWVIGLIPFVWEIFLREDSEVRRTLTRLYLAPVSVFVVTAIIKFFYHTPRPFAYLEIPPAFVVSSDPFGLASFPSSHTAFFAALATTMYFCNHTMGKWYMLAAFVIGFARIGAGVHWPLDILGGALLGISIAVLIEFLLPFVWKDHMPKC